MKRIFSNGRDRVVYDSYQFIPLAAKLISTSTIIKFTVTFLKATKYSMIHLHDVFSAGDNTSDMERVS